MPSSPQLSVTRQHASRPGNLDSATFHLHLVGTSTPLVYLDFPNPVKMPRAAPSLPSLSAGRVCAKSRPTRAQSLHGCRRWDPLYCTSCVSIQSSLHQAHAQRLQVLPRGFVARVPLGPNMRHDLGKTQHYDATRGQLYTRYPPRISHRQPGPVFLVSAGLDILVIKAPPSISTLNQRCAVYTPPLDRFHASIPSDVA